MTDQTLVDKKYAEFQAVGEAITKTQDALEILYLKRTTIRNELRQLAHLPDPDDVPTPTGVQSSKEADVGKAPKEGK